MRRLRLEPPLISLCAVTLLLVCQPARAQEEGLEYEQLLKQPRIYSWIINYLRSEKKIASKPVELPPADSLKLITVDFLLSLSCLWLALFVLTGSKKLPIKRYLWFLFVFNLAWFIFLLFLRMVWSSLDYLIIKLRPDLGAAFADNLCLVVLLSSPVLYVWLLARTFGFNLSGSLGVFSLSHLGYFLAIALFSAVVSGQGAVDTPARQALGLRPVIQDYMSDADKIVSGKGLWPLVRARPFRI